MSLKQLIIKQYREHVDQTANSMSDVTVPEEGWIRTVRKSLNMTGTQLANRLKVTKGLISKTEKAELSGGVTLKNMQNMAEAMNCRFVYAIVPEDSIESIIQKQAELKAKEFVKQASIQMALEAQALSEQALQAEVERITNELGSQINSELWN